MALHRGRLLQPHHLPLGHMSAASPEGVGPARRWAADPLILLGIVALAGLATPAPGVGFVAPVLLAVVAAGLALAGST